MFFEGHLHLNKDRGRSAEQNEASIAGRSSAAAAAVVVVVVPSLPLPATPTPPTNSPTPPDQNALHLNSGRREECEPNTAPASPSSRSRPLAPEEEEESREREEESVPEQDWELQLGPAGSERSPPATPLSHGSLSDLSRPPSSLFSRSTHLTSGRSSVLSGKNLWSNIYRDDEIIVPKFLYSYFFPTNISKPKDISSKIIYNRERVFISISQVLPPDLMI